MAKVCYFTGRKTVSGNNRLWRESSVYETGTTTNQVLMED